MARCASLSRHPDFLKLWFAQTLAALSAFVTTLAVPLIAAVSLQASPFQMGLLTTVATLPNLVFGLLVGSWVDRTRRRSLMVPADVLRAVLLVSIPAAVLAVPTARRLGLGRTIIGANLLGSLCLLLIPLAFALPTGAAMLLGGAQAGSHLLGAVFYINQTSVRQLITPERLLGRLTASYRFLTMGMMPLGSLVGGVLGSLLGVPTTVLIGTLGTLFAAGWLVWSPARAIHGLDAQDEHTESLARL